MATLQMASVEVTFSPHSELPAQVGMAEAPRLSPPLCPSHLGCPRSLHPVLASRGPRIQSGTTTWRSVGGRTLPPFLGALEFLSGAGSVVLANRRQHKKKLFLILCEGSGGGGVSIKFNLKAVEEPLFL